MKVSFQGFLGKCHSWSQVQHNIARQLIKRGHCVEMQSTNGLEHFPDDLKPNLKELTSGYDMQISYTAPFNFQRYMPSSRSSDKPNRFGIWTTEYTELPAGFAKNYHHVEKILAPSAFSRQSYLNDKVPEDKVVVVPHGINKEDFENLGKLELKTKKKLKFCMVITQPHLRKGIEDSFEAYCKAFKKTDDVCLVAKISTKKIEAKFEVDVLQIIKKINQKYPNHAEIELIKEYVPNINDLYNTCDVVFLLSKGEGFGLPYLEGLAADKLIIAPRSGGQLDFLNDDNSLLVEGKFGPCPQAAQYWQPSATNGWFNSNIDSAIAQLRNVYNNHESIREKTKAARQATVDKFTWSNAVDQIIGLLNV